MNSPSSTILSQEQTFSPSTSRSLPSAIVTPSVPHLDNLQPRITAAPSTSSCPPNTLIIQLSTTLVIPNYSLFFAPTPIDSFRPTYSALADGTLLASPFHQDLMDANLSLLVTGALAMLFIRNILVSGDYLRRGKVKKKSLFYVLFLSQILAPMAFVPIILSYFSERIHCTVVIILSCLSGTTSLALLITGILGVKVYKCLNNPLFVPVILGLFQAASTTVVVFDIIATQGIRRLTGSCIRNNDLRFTRYFVSIQFLESLFICCCFIYVCWRSRGSPAARGRISLELSMDELPNAVPNDPVDTSPPARRGWWDYVPDNKASQQQQPREGNRTSSEAKIGTRSIFKGILAKTMRSSSKPTEEVQEKSKSTRLSKKEVAIPGENSGGPSSRLSLAPSSTSRFSRLVPRMELFREVMKDELFYTTFITSNCVVVAVLAVIGVNFKNGLNVTGWIALNWGIISLLAIHSFGRVVHRHERDALLQHPITCTAIMRAANDIAEKDERRRALSSAPSRAKSLRITSFSNIDDPNDPFADTQPLELKKPFISALDDENGISIDSALSMQISQRDCSPGLYGSPGNLHPSPQDQDFPTSTLGTPLVPLDSSCIARQQGFSRSWLVSRSSISNFSLGEHSFKGK